MAYVEALDEFAAWIDSELTGGYGSPPGPDDQAFSIIPGQTPEPPIWKPAFWSKVYHFFHDVPPEFGSKPPPPRADMSHIDKVAQLAIKASWLAFVGAGQWIEWQSKDDIATAQAMVNNVQKQLGVTVGTQDQAVRGLYAYANTVAKAWAADALASAKTYADARTRQLLALIGSIEHDLLNVISRTAVGLRSYTDARTRQLLALIGSVERDVLHVITVSSGWDRAFTTAQTAKVSANLAAAKADLAGQVKNAVLVSESYASTAAKAAEAGAVTLTLSKLAPTLAKVTAELDTCVAPLCDTVTPNASQLGRLGNLLKGLEGLGLAAVLAALVAEAVHDPQTAAAGVVDALGWAPDEATGLVDAVVG